MAECIPSDNIPDEGIDLTKLSLSENLEACGAHCNPKPPPTENFEEPEEPKVIEKPLNMKPGAVQLRSWLNQFLRVTMSDGRVLIGMFFCTDRDANIILGACSEYLPEEVDEDGKLIKDVEEPRILGLVMVPGKHIVNISVDVNEEHATSCAMSRPLLDSVPSDEVM